MKKTLITLLALASGLQAEESLVPYLTSYTNDEIHLTDYAAGSGITVAFTLDVVTLKNYLAKGADLVKYNLADVECHYVSTKDGVTTEGSNKIGIQTNYSSQDSKINVSGLYGTWNQGGTYNFGLRSEDIDPELESFWTNVTGVSIVLSSGLNVGVASGGTAEEKGSTAVLTLQKTVDGAITYDSYGGSWVNNLYASTFTEVESITFDKAVKGAVVYDQVVSTQEAKDIGIKAFKLIPEPTSTTLSLLALAGLMLRRRRK